MEGKAVEEPAEEGKRDFDAVSDKEKEAAKKPDNLVRLTTRTPLKKVITYILHQLDAAGEVHISALGKAIEKGVQTAEIVKARVGNLHSITEEGIMNVVHQEDKTDDKGQPVTTEVEAKAAFIKITLSKRELDTEHYGYQQCSESK